MKNGCLWMSPKIGEWLRNRRFLTLIFGGFLPVFGKSCTYKMLVDARKGVHFGEPFLFEIPRSANGQLMLIATSNLIFHRANHLCAWIDYFTGNLRKFKFEKHPNWSPIILLGYFSSRNLVTNKPGTSWGSGNFTNFLGYDRHVKYGMSREWWDILYIYILVWC